MLPAVLQQVLPVAPQHPPFLAVLLLLLLLELELPAEGLADQSQGQQARLHTVLHPLTVLLPAAGTAAGPARLGCPLFVLVDPCLFGQQAMAAALERPLQAYGQERGSKPSTATPVMSSHSCRVIRLDPCYVTDEWSRKSPLSQE